MKGGENYEIQEGNTLSNKIDPTINGGFIVAVGCNVKLAYGNLKELRKASDEYFADPDKVHEEYKKTPRDELPEPGPGNMAPTGTGGGLTAGQQSAISPAQARAARERW